MSRGCVLLLWLCVCAPAVAAQQVPADDTITIETLPLEMISSDPIFQQPVSPRASTADQGTLLRALDKISGEVVDFDLTPGQTKQLGRIQVTLGECRYPSGNPASDASAYLTIRNAGEQAPAFAGWMIASSPALNGLDHARYDVWVLRCITS